MKVSRIPVYCACIFHVFFTHVRKKGGPGRATRAASWTRRAPHRVARRSRRGPYRRARRSYPHFLCSSFFSFLLFPFSSFCSFSSSYPYARRCKEVCTHTTHRCTSPRLARASIVRTAKRSSVCNLLCRSSKRLREYIER